MNRVRTIALQNYLNLMCCFIIFLFFANINLTVRSKYLTIIIVDTKDEDRA